MHLVPVRRDDDVVVVEVDARTHAGTGALSGAEDGPPTEPRPERARREPGSWPEVIGAHPPAPQDRWVFDDTNRWYPAALVGGQRVERAHDLRLSRVILRHSPLAAHTDLAVRAADEWDAMTPTPAAPVAAAEPDPALFDLADAGPPATDPTALDPVNELLRQLAAVAASTDPGRLRLLLAAESAGALVAAEMQHAGLPWRADVHDEILTAVFGPRPAAGERPARLEQLARQVRDALDAPGLNPDSLPGLLKALQYAGLPVRTTSKWELRGIDHPVVEPLLEYKRLSRLLAANGWSWLDTWVAGGRFRTEYVVGGVVTGRWATSGGGALQLPKAVRGAVVADPGWVFVVADAAQLEPRVLAGLACDERMARAGRGGDMYQGMVDSGAVDSREHAKVGMLGAMYGGTTGQSAVVLPRLIAAFPDALGLVDRAAQAGERGEVVATRLGRGSPPPGAAWYAAQARAFEEESGADAASRARSRTRAWGRFTRNFVVQGTAAEWALCWLALTRQRLWALGEGDAEGLAPAPFTRRPHLVFFLHDEVIVHTPAALAEVVAGEVRAAAVDAGRLLFGDFPVDFPLTVAITGDYAAAK